MLKTFFKRALALLTAIGLMGMLIGCDLNDGVDSPVGSIEDLQGYPDDLSLDDGCSGVPEDSEGYVESVISSEFYAYGDGNDERINEVAEFSVVRGQLERFETMDYQYTPQFSFAVSGTVVPEGMADTFHGEVVNLVMEFVPDTLPNAVHVAYFDSPELGQFVQSSILTAIAPHPDSGYVRVDDTLSLWCKSFRPIEFRGHSEPLALWSWDTWYWCTVKKAIAGCAAAAAGCVVSGPLWPECAAAGCSMAFIGAAVYCALDQI